MKQHKCIIPGCRKPGRAQLSLRARTPATDATLKDSATWSRELGAYLCDTHAYKPLVVTLSVELASEEGMTTVTTALKQRRDGDYRYETVERTTPVPERNERAELLAALA